MLLNDGVASASDPCARVAVRDPFHLPLLLVDFFLYVEVSRKSYGFFQVPSVDLSSSGGGSMVQSFGGIGIIC
jgi:hypothetical protein